jgi:prepilin-type N-terminal cleavage/methylation domain-containing protein
VRIVSFLASKHVNKKGFTLSELLVSLTVIGLIAGLAIPNLVINMNRNKERTLLRAAIRTINEATTKVFNELPVLASPNNTTWHAYDTVLNSADDSFVASGSTANSFILPGGVVVSGFNLTYSQGVESILLDVNGTIVPNAIGKDRVMLTACFNPTGVCPATTNLTVEDAKQEAGTVGPTPDTGTGSGTGNVAFYTTITQTI